MEEQIGPQILLLPTTNYWEWVDAARDYALAYGASLTAVPQNAAQYHYPAQVITVVVPSYGTEAQTRALSWLKSEAPRARIDVLNADTPANLAAILQTRLGGNARYGDQELSASPPTTVPLRFQLLWPTDYPEVDQGFGENSALYRRWGLPGHEGIDFRTTYNGRVYACAGGEVYLAHDGAGNHPYGVHVRIKHQDGWKTIYAHLNEALVHAGQHVTVGELIGRADQTGSSAGRHVHLTLKREGASSGGLTPYPNDIIDPTPYLHFPADRKLIEPDFEMVQWPYGECLVGLQSRLDEPMTSPDWDVVRTGRVQALRLTNRSALSDLEEALILDPNMFVLVSLLVDHSGRRVSPDEFASEMEHIVYGYYTHGVRYFEVAYEPNVTSCGLGTNWHSGREFGEWFLNVVGSLRGVAPEARFGWPGLSPGDDAGMRVDHQEFLTSAGNLVSQADWIGCHCYWESGETMFKRSAALSYQHYREEWPDKQIFITEFCNPSPSVLPSVKGREYVRFYRHLIDEPGVSAAFASCSSALANYDHEVWRREDGAMTGIADVVGARNF